MDYLHKSQGHTQSKTVKEPKVTLCAKRERERRRCAASAAEGPTLKANNHVVKAKKSLANLKTCLKQTHTRQEHTVSEVKWAHCEISKDGCLIGQRNINSKERHSTEQPNKPSSVSRVFLFIDHLEVMASKDDLVPDEVNKVTLHCYVVTSSRVCSVLMEP